MAVPANAAVRENRRRATALELERINVIKALTAAEYSRRQFILNFAATRDTKLLIPGRKSDAVKAAEEWVAAWLSQTDYVGDDQELFKYSVDARLWATHVGSSIEFPFAFMRGSIEVSPSETSNEAELKDHGSEAFLLKEIDVRDVETSSPTAQPRRGSWRKQRQPSVSTIQSEDPKADPRKSPFLVRLGRSWTRRRSSSS
ncbi:uncharacterized protein B0T15DRAFT_3560 [Chaetomium strumarium]|uniref:Uncharacterized protein n=1 Tax=Chaetomium strumarium TaxID=1170767 RepID=A0AAJ0H097_9PEZI|nr:hypothetical protein B0T15DRAFT_3560 [Chaetomium strumarium]